MSSRFLHEWNHLFFAPLQVLGRLTAVVKPLEPITTALFGVGIYAGLSWLFWKIPIAAPWKILLLAVIPIWWASFTAGRAWEISNDFSIFISPLAIDGPTRMFYMRIRNGPVPIQMVGNIVRITGAKGDDRRLGRSWEGHWRDQPASFNGDLAALEEEDYGWLHVREQLASGNSTLCVYSRETTPWHARAGDHSLVSASLDVPLHEQGTVTFEVVFDCKIPSQKRGKIFRRTFSLAPDANSPARYVIVSDEETAPIRSYRLSD